MKSMAGNEKKTELEDDDEGYCLGLFKATGLEYLAASPG